MNLVMRRCVGVAVAVWGLVLAGGAAYAQSYSYWTNSAGGSWSSGANWTNGTPSAGGGSTVGLVFQPNATYTANNDLAGDFALTNITVNSGTVTLSGGTLQWGATGYITNNSTGLLTISNDFKTPTTFGVNNIFNIGGSGAGGVVLGGRVTGNGAYGGSVYFNNYVDVTYGGIYSNGQFRFEPPTGKTGTVSGEVRSCGTLDLCATGKLIYNGVATNGNEALRIGYDISGTPPIEWRGTGTFDVLLMGGWSGAGQELLVRSGGVLTIRTRADKDLIIGSGSTATNQLTVGDSGTMSIGAHRYMRIGDTQNGVLNVQSNGNLSITGWTNLVLGVTAGKAGIINLDGGVMGVQPTITGSNGVSIINFNGGTLRALTNNAAWITGISTGAVKAGGAVIDTQTYTNTIAQALVHDAALGATPDGGLVKLGTGTLIFAGTNTYTGPTTISNGTLRLAFDNGAATNSAVTVASGAALDMAGYNQSLVALAGTGLITNLNSGKTLTVTGTNTFSGSVAGGGSLVVSGVISPAGAGTIGQQTVAGPLALTGVLAVDVATDGTSDLLVTQGSLNLTGSRIAVVNTNGLNIDRQYVVLCYSNTPSAGSLGESLLPLHWTLKDDPVSKRILLRRARSGVVLTIQ